MGSCAAPSAKGDDKFITTDYLQQCRVQSGFSDFHGSALVPCGGWVQSRFSCSGPEIVSQFLQRVPLTPG
ncbi:hypothetical protein FKL08_26290, partial [Klebsiella pneumoniae]|nr:hypothetical protein [Klebsiella pneumoniae]